MRYAGQRLSLIHILPTTLDMTYSNQQNNKRAGYTFTIGDAVYYPSRNGMGYMVQGREGKVSFSQCPAQESETYVVYTKDDSDPYKLYVYSKAEEAVVLKIKDVERLSLIHISRMVSAVPVISAAPRATSSTRRLMSSIWATRGARM